MFPSCTKLAHIDHEDILTIFRSVLSSDYFLKFGKRQEASSNAFLFFEILL